MNNFADAKVIHTLPWNSDAITTVAFIGNDRVAAGNKRGEGAGLCGHGLLLLKQGQKGNARELWKQGEAILKEIDDEDLLKTVSGDMRKACDSASVLHFNL